MPTSPQPPAHIELLCCSTRKRRALATAILFSFAGSFSRAQPANDMFVNRGGITGTNVLAAGSNIGATKEPGEPDHADNSGGASVWWDYAFGDGSVRAIRFGESLCPLKLWAVTEKGRADYAVCRPK